MKEITKQGYKGRELTCYLFDEVTDAKGVVVLVHGMQEHALRYLEFAKFLNDKGYILFATDLRGHGKNMLDGKPGFENGDIFENIVEDYKSQDLLINSRVYQSGELYVTKSYKINAAVYTEFQQMMIEKYPHYRIQDAIGQALLEFVAKYK